MSIVPPPISSQASEWMPSSSAARVRSPAEMSTAVTASMASAPEVTSKVPPSMLM